MSLKDVESLVDLIVKDACKPDTDVKDRTDALKAVTAFLLAKVRLDKGREDEPDENSFAAWQGDLEENADGGTAKVRSRRQ